MPQPHNYPSALAMLQQEVVACTRCQNLIEYCGKVAREKRRMYLADDYWGKPLPSFGDPNAQVLILGLAPAAHGGNRTGRMFTGDRSGEFLYRALYDTGFANQPESRHRHDGLELRGCYITAALRCAPPQNKPRPEELRNCQSYLEKEFELLHQVRVVLALGKIAFDTYLRLAPRLVFQKAALQHGVNNVQRDTAQKVFPPRSSFHFAHGASFALPQGLPRLFSSYHPSQQNTQTGKLTPVMMREVLHAVRNFLDSSATYN